MPTNNPNLKLSSIKSVWRYVYLGTGIELVQWTDPIGKLIWNYYITLTPRFVPPEVFTPLHDHIEAGGSYYDPVFTPREAWWHGGVTYANNPHFRSWDGKKLQSLEIGCDYNHLEDAFRTYTHDDVLADALRTADDLIKLLSISPTPLPKSST